MWESIDEWRYEHLAKKQIRPLPSLLATDKKGLSTIKSNKKKKENLVSIDYYKIIFDYVCFLMAAFPHGMLPVFA